MNEDVECALWFLQQFINVEIIKENLLEGANAVMRSLLAGLIYCAMLKIYSIEKSTLNYFWEDVNNNIAIPRQSTLGNFILTFLTLLPTLKKFNHNQPQFLQILARFSTLGLESRSFLIQAGTLERLLNYFFWECSPYMKDFQNAPQLPFQYNLSPEIGLPTPQAEVKKSSFAQLKEANRLKRLQTDEPHFQFLFEIIGNIGRSINNSNHSATIYQLD